MNFRGEIEDVRQVIKLAEKWGYGNLIHRLKLAWALMLLRSDQHIRTCFLAAGLEEKDIPKGSKEDIEKLLIEHSGIEGK